MKVLVVLSFVLVAAVAQPVFPGLGLGGDLPDVATAKATHLTTQAVEAARNTLGIPNIPAAVSATAAADATNAARNALAAQGLSGIPNIVIGPNGVPIANLADPTSRLALATAVGAGIQSINNANTLSQLQLRAINSANTLSQLQLRTALLG